MTITADALAAALREALPDCEIGKGDAPQRFVVVLSSLESDFSVAYLSIEEQDIIASLRCESRADRDLARAVFDVIDRLEDRDAK